MGGFPSTAPDWAVKFVYSRMQGEKRSCFEFMEPEHLNRLEREQRALYEKRSKRTSEAEREELQLRIIAGLQSDTPAAPAVSAEDREQMQRRVRNAIKIF
jgi:hypothetical protein